MDRRTVQPGQIPLDGDLLETNKNAMIGLGKLIEAVFGTSNLLQGFACVPTAPSSMQVSVGAGQVFSLQNIDATTYGSLAADILHQIVKQGLSLDAALLSCPAPLTIGYSINYLVQVAFSEVDTDFSLRTYYNAAEPTEPYMGAGNSGVQDATRRADRALVAVKAGAAATTGAQTTPAPDAGYIGAWVVTVAYGATTIETGAIALYAGAPFLTETLQTKVSQASSDARYLLRSGGTMTGAITLPGNPTNPLEAAPKQYVDGLASGIQIKGNVAVATLSANVTLSGEQTIDGVLTSASRILVKAQTLPANNGIWVTGAGAWTRATDMDAWAEVPGALVLVTGGSTQAGSAWICSSAAGGTLNTTAITFQQFANAGSYQAANALLAAIAALAANGIVVRTGAGAAAARSIAAGAGIAVTNGDGVANNPTVAADLANAAQMRAAAANKLLDPAGAFGAAVTVILAYASTIALDFNTFFNAKATLTGNVIFGSPTNLKDGQMGKIEVFQDAIGGRTATFHANILWTGGVDGVLSTAPNARDVIYYCGLSDGKAHFSLNRALA